MDALGCAADMRIAHLTGGTGGFYCGTCIRDNALVVALQVMGHDAYVVPLYLPVVSEGPDASAGVPLFFGGINVFLQEHSALFRGLPQWVDRALDSPMLLRMLSRRASATDAGDLGAITLSMLQGPTGRQAKEVTRLLDWLLSDPPDVVVVSNSLLSGVVPAIRRRLGVPVVVTLQGEMHFLDAVGAGRDAAWRELSKRLAEADAVVAVSEFCANAMHLRTGLPRKQMDVVPPGVDVKGFATREVPPDPPVLGYLARLSDEKGLDLVVDAFIELHRREPGRPLRLAVAGTTRAGHEAFLEEQRAKLSRARLSHKSDFFPDLSPRDKRSFLTSLTAFCVPGRPGETSSIPTIEAMAAAVPVVFSARGAVCELFEATGGGVQMTADTSDALADAVQSLVEDSQMATALGRRGREAVEKGFSSVSMAEGMMVVLNRCVLAREVA